MAIDPCSLSTLSAPLLVLVPYMVNMYCIWQTLVGVFSVSHIVLAVSEVKRAGVDDGCREEISLPYMIFIC